MSAASSTAGKSQEVPLDIFYEILLKSGVKDLSFLWINCRQVSRNFKDAVERVFVTRHLKKTWIHIDPGKCYSSEHGKVFLASEFKFSHLDPADPSRAIFKDEECHRHEDFHAEFTRRMFADGPLLERPRAIVQVRRSANDTMLPGFQSNSDPDSGVFEVSFEWKGMYSHFFREQKEVESVKDEVRAIGQEDENDPEGGLGLNGSLMRVMQMYATTSDEIHKAIRSERIQRNVLEKEGREVSGRDDAGYQRVKEMAHTIGWEDPYSDEESEREEEERDSADESEGEEVDVDESSEGPGSAE